MTENNNFSFFQNRACEYFPCHEGVSEEDFNCLFCFCPLYALGRKCGGCCTYTEKGVKSCKACTFPHEKGNYDAILARYGDIADVVKRSDMEDI
ncbi:MAG: cysteine-rich small domain-containing protein [Clostridia bacterium]|nr:cysteine-rich small domain-containing protein [Clostridia bacterium]